MGCRILLLMLASVIVQYAAQEIRKTSVCLRDELAVEVYLHCSSTERLYILRTQHGVQNLHRDEFSAPGVSDPNTANGTIDCEYREHGQDKCAEPLADLDVIEESCMGRHDCRPQVAPIHLHNCDSVSNYFQVSYKCLTENSGTDKSKFADICGDNTHSNMIARTSGYIESMDYPNNYQPDVMCTCSMRAARPDARIYLQLLDYDLQSDKPRNYDWLEYTTDMDMWGNDRAITVRDQTVATNSMHIFLNFRTNGRYEGRGFWLEYEARTGGGQEAEVQVMCHEYQPSYQKRKSTCLVMTDYDELHLSCGALGVINIIYAQTGYRNLSATECSEYVRWHACAEEVTHHSAILDVCMGQVWCNVEVMARLMPECSLYSNYMQVEYECVADTDEKKLMTDVCGDQLMYGSLERQVGYIQSLDYPNGYSDQTRCTCRLETTVNHASIQLTLLDMSLEAARGQHSSCESDWLEYVVGGEQDWGGGTKMCRQPKGEPIHTGSKTVYINFQTDDSTASGEGRGFWIKYAGKTTDNTLALVQVTCGPYDPDGQDGQDVVVVMPTGSKPGPESTTDGGGLAKNMEPDDDDDDDEGNKKNLVLIVCLVAVVALMFIVVVGLAAVKYSRTSKSNVHEPSADSPLDTGYNSMKRTYSAFSNHSAPYSPFRNNPSLTASLKSVASQHTTSTGLASSEPAPDYHDDVVFVRGGSRGNAPAYHNPAFDGIPEGGAPISPAGQYRSRGDQRMI